MGTYYYLLSSVPYLSLEQPAAVELASFREACTQWLTPADLAILDDIDKDLPLGKSRSDVLSRFAALEWGLRNALARARASRLGLDVQESLRLLDGYRDGADQHPVSEIARAAVAAEHPLEAEAILDRWRWRILDDLEVGHHFDIESVVIYFIKLRILERRRSVTIPEGRKNYAASYDEVAKSFPLDVES